MVAHVLRLRIALLFGGLRGESRRTVRVALGLALFVAVTAAAGIAVLSLADTTIDTVAAVTVSGGSALTLGFFLAPIVAGSHDVLDPRRFRVFAIAPDSLAGALALAGLLSAPVLAMTAVACCVAVTWVGVGVGWLAAGAGIVLGILTCTLLARVAMGLAALMFSERRSRELSGSLLVAVLVVVVPVGVFLGSLEWDGRVPPALTEAVTILGYTPLGAAWAFPVGLAHDDAGAWMSLLVAVVTLVLLALAWVALVRRQLSTIERPLTVRERGGLGWFSVFPGTPGGAVAARSLIYWLRDRRYLVNMVVIPIAAVLTVVPLLVAGVPGSVAALVPVLFVALFLGWLPHNDLAYDSTAVWIHIASGVRGIADRGGRLVPVFGIAVPLLAVGIPISVAIHGRWALAPAMVGVCASLFLCGLGLSSISSVLAPYAVTSPGESPFRQPQRMGSSGAVPQTLVMLGSLLLSAPSLWFLWVALTSDSEASILAFVVGVATGVVVGVGGVLAGAALFDRRSERIMEFVETT